MSDHSFIAPSSASTWVKCPGAPTLAAAFPQEDTEASNEGTSAHDMIARCLAGNPMDQVGTLLESGIVVTQEMYESAMCFVAEVTSHAGERGVLSNDFHIEERIECPAIHDESFGSVDLWFYDETNHDLFIYDFKHGHDLVEVEHNWQLLNYSSGILSKLLKEGVNINKTNVWLCIIQPRGFHGDGPVRYWLALPEIREAAYGELIHAAEQVYGPSPKCIPGKHCRYCSGHIGCDAANNAAMFAADMATEATPHELTADQAGTQLAILESAAKAIEYRLTGIREQVKSIIKKGQNVKGWSVINAFGNLAWTAPFDACMALEAMTGLKLLQPPKMITPTQARNAGVPPPLIDKFAGRQSKGLKLVASDEKAKSVFK